MRYGVVYMHDLNPVSADYVDQFARKCKFIGLVQKERIIGHVDLVKKNVLVEQIEPHGLFVGDKMHLVPAFGKGDAKFCGDYAASAKGGITNYCDFHSVKILNTSGEKVGLLKI